MREMKPINSPMLTSWAMSPNKFGSARRSRANPGSSGASSSAVSAPSATRSVTGKFATEKKGRTSRKALTRRKTNSQLLRSSSMAARPGSLDHLRQLLNHGDGKFCQRAHDPGQEQQQHADDRERFGDESQGLLVNRRDRLKQAHGQANDHRGHQQRRGDG